LRLLTGHDLCKSSEYSCATYKATRTIFDSSFFLLIDIIVSLNIDIDSGFYTVKFDSLLLKDAVVEADCIIPPLREDDPISSDSDLDDTGDGDATGYAKGIAKKHHVAN